MNAQKVELSKEGEVDFCIINMISKASSDPSLA